jgi:hypothetical protein
MDELARAIEGADTLPVLVLVVDTTEMVAHLLVADGPDDDVACCGERPPLGAWSPVQQWPMAQVCRDCVQRP